MRRIFLLATLLLFPPVLTQADRRPIEPETLAAPAAPDGLVDLPDQTPPPRRVPPTDPSAGEQPVFRELQPGESRVEGGLERLECRPNGQVFVHIRAKDRLWRFTAVKFGAIEFISYRSDITGAIVCRNRRPMDRVYATYRKPENARQLDGVVVVLEYLPMPPK